MRPRRECRHGRPLSICAVCAPEAEARYKARRARRSSNATQGVAGDVVDGIGPGDRVELTAKGRQALAEARKVGR